jgi:TRAP-type mannitol/chloroaromatic compound transport system permease small subunit
LLYSSWDYTSNSWQIHEESPEAGGLPLVFILKTLIPVMPILLASQVIANMIDHLKVLRSTSQVSN